MFAKGAKKNGNRYHPAFILVYLPGLLAVLAPPKRLRAGDASKV